MTYCFYYLFTFLKLRKEIEFAKETMKNIEYELDLLDATIDSVSNLNDKEQIENMKKYVFVSF